MLIKDSFLKKLRGSFDLNIYEVKIWTALLSRGVASAGELSDISGVPRSRSYDVLESLEKKGYIVMKLGKPIKYIAVEPEEVVKRVKQNLQIKAEEKLNALDNVKVTQIYNDLDVLYKQGIDKIDPAEISGIIKGRKNIYNHLKSLISNAESSVRIITTENGIIRKNEYLKSVLKKAKTKGVDIKIATNAKTKSIPEELKKITQVKKIDGHKARISIIDGKHVLFMLNHDEDIHEAYDLGIWVKTPFFGLAMKQMFDISWDQFKSL